MEFGSSSRTSKKVVPRTRKYFIGANWKSTGTTHFVKDIITHLINPLEYDTRKLGKGFILKFNCIFRFDAPTWCIAYKSSSSHG